MRFSGTRFLLLLAPPGCASFVSVPPVSVWSKPTAAGFSFLVQATNSNLTDVFDDFERWFSTIPGAKCDPGIKHNLFGGCLRGLSWQTLVGHHGQNIVQVPKSAVLQSDFGSEDWDYKLAEDLWLECLKGASSPIAGYTALLTKGWDPSDLPNTPPSTSPDALRHWSPEQRKLLANNTAGKRLLDLQNEQEGIWRGKFNCTSGMTWDQFEWAMEAVHSRAFCGDFGIGSSRARLVVPVIAPALSAAAGWVYSVPYHGQDDSVLLVLGITAVVPAIFNILSQRSMVAVLLPLIDSANHLKNAESNIEYNPTSDAFTLSAGKNCFVVEDSGERQLYISYGNKKDTELLLNYGFLNEASPVGSDDIRREILASTFLSKQTRSIGAGAQ